MKKTKKPKTKQQDLMRIWRFVKDKPQAERLIKSYANAMHYSPEYVKLWLLEGVREKVKGIPEAGELELTVTYSRPVLITYLDTGEESQINTISQLALVGQVEFVGVTYNLFTLWIGRVFPQWRSKPSFS